MVTMALFTDEIRKSAGNAGIKTFTSKLDQGLMADAVTRGELPGMLSLFLSIFIFFRQRRAYVRKSILGPPDICSVHCQDNFHDIVYAGFVLQSISQSLLTLAFRQEWE